MLRELASGAPAALCAPVAPTSTAEIARTSQHVPISTVRETERLFEPSSSFSSALNEMRGLLLSPDELNTCVAAPGCTSKQRELLQAAARALSSYATVLDDVRATLGGDVSIKPTIEMASRRAARLRAGGERLARIGSWTRSLAQPEGLDAQLRRAECRDSADDGPGAAALSCSDLTDLTEGDGTGTGTGGVIALARLASSAIRWPLEVRKVVSTLSMMKYELVDMKPSADALLTRTREVARRLDIAALIAPKMPRLATALQMAANVSARGHLYAEGVSLACDHISGLLDQPMETWSPLGVWVQRDPSAFPHGPGSWESISAALAQLEAAHESAAHAASACQPGLAESRLAALEVSLPAVLNNANDPGLFYGACSGAIVDAQAQALCLVSELLPSLTRQLDSAEGVLSRPKPPQPHTKRILQEAAMADTGSANDDLATCPTNAGGVDSDARAAADVCQPDSAELEDDFDLSDAKAMANRPDCGDVFSDGAQIGICSPERVASLYRSCRQKDEKAFIKKSIQFHFGTLPPISPLSLPAGKPEHWHFDRVRTRFPVPLIDSEYSMQSSTFYSLQWPIGLTKPKKGSCAGCPKEGAKYCDADCSCVPAGCFGTCLPNAVGYLPERYLMTFKHGVFQDCNHMCGSDSCSPTIIAMANSKGRLVDTWQVMIPSTFSSEHDGVQDFCDWGAHTWKPYKGSLTGIAHTRYKENGAVYACGRLGTQDQGGNWFLFRFRALLDSRGHVRQYPGFSKGEAYIDQAIALRWLGPENDDMTVERCVLAHQPGWGGRGSADTGVMPKLWVSPVSYGKDAWMATARGCPLALQTGCAGTIEDEEERCRVGVKVGLDRSKAEGLLLDPECFLSHMSADDGSKRFVEHGWHLQVETLLANVEHRATHLVVGDGVHGLAFFDNKLDESYAAIGRCKGPAETPNGFWRDFCYLEFHWYDAKLTLDKVVAMIDVVGMISRAPFGRLLGMATTAFRRLEDITQGPAAQQAIERFKNTGDKWYLQSFRLELEVPVTFTRPVAARIERERDSVKNLADYTMWYFPALLVGPLLSQLLFGWGGATMVRAMKVPAGLLSLAHDSSVGARPHNFFHVAFGYGTRENRFASTRLADGLSEENRIFLLRHPILQTLMDPDLMKSEDVLDASLLGISIFRIPKIGFADLLTNSFNVDPNDVYFGMPYRCKYVCTGCSKKDKAAGKKKGLKCLKGTEEYNDRGSRVAYSEMPLSLLLKFVASKGGAPAFKSEEQANREREARDTDGCGRGKYSSVVKSPTRFAARSARQAAGHQTRAMKDCKECDKCPVLKYRKGCTGRSAGRCTACSNCAKGKVRVNCGFDTSAKGFKAVDEGQCVPCKQLCDAGSYSPFCLNAMHNSVKYTKALRLPKTARAPPPDPAQYEPPDMAWMDDDESEMELDTSTPCTKVDRYKARFGNQEAVDKCEPTIGQYQTKPRKKCDEWANRSTLPLPCSA